MPPTNLAAALLAARKTRHLVEAAAWPGLPPDPQASAAINAGVVAALDGQAGLPRCWKAGGPARDEALITQSPLPSSTVLALDAEGCADASALWLPHAGAEAEIALRLGREVTPEEAAQLRPEQAWNLVDAFCVAIELTASRWLEGPAAPAALRTADLQSHGALVLGPWRPVVSGHDWSQQACEIRINDKEPLRRVGSHALGDPAWLLPAWLRRISAGGQVVPAGTVVTTGSWTGTLPVAAGDRVAVAFEGLGRVAVQV